MCLCMREKERESKLDLRNDVVVYTWTGETISCHDWSPRIIQRANNTPSQSIITSWLNSLLIFRFIIPLPCPSTTTRSHTIPLYHSLSHTHGRARPCSQYVLSPSHHTHADTHPNPSLHSPRPPLVNHK